MPRKKCIGPKSFIANSAWRMKKEIIKYSFRMRACNQTVIKIDENIVDEIRFAKNEQR